MKPKQKSDNSNNLTHTNEKKHLEAVNVLNLLICAALHHAINCASLSFLLRTQAFVDSKMFFEVPDDELGIGQLFPVQFDEWQTSFFRSNQPTSHHL